MYYIPHCWFLLGTGGFVIVDVVDVVVVVPVTWCSILRRTFVVEFERDGLGNT